MRPTETHYPEQGCLGAIGRSLKPEVLINQTAEGMNCIS
jgi:hypothetical protein